MTDIATGSLSNGSPAGSSSKTNQDVADAELASTSLPSSKTTTIDTTRAESNNSVADAASLHPFVHWAQSQTHVSLRVDLTQVQNLDIDIRDAGSSLSFSAKDNKVDCHAIERYVLILIKKADQQISWPRLTKKQLKYPWLRVDFDRYHTGDSDESSDNDDNRELLQGKQSYDLLRQQLDEARQQREETEDKWRSSNSWFTSLNNIFRRNIQDTSSRNMKHDYRKETVAMDNSKNIAKHALDAKKTYLFLYNLIMFIMFLKVYIVLLIKGISGTVDDDVVQGAALIIKILTYTQLIETVHPMLGLVPGGPLMPFTQVVGRLLVNHFLSEPEIRLDAAPYAHYLFVVWSSIEIFRYSFYALRVFKVNIYPLTWCRYTLFMPLYPMGGLCESMVVFSTIKFYEKTGDYSINLPNAANASFNLPLALKIYTYLVLGPTIYFLMKYMWRQRCKQLKEKVV